MTRPTKNLRLFVAAYPPNDLARAMVEHVDRLVLPSRARPTPIDQVHLTLQFIGDVCSSDLDVTIESVRRAAAGLATVTLDLQRLVALPERGPKRLIAAETSSPATLMELQKRLAVRLATKGRDRSSRGFRPHMTLCRFATPVTYFAIDESSARINGSVVVDEIVLMRSTLSPAGATHHAVSRVALG